MKRNFSLKKKLVIGTANFGQTYGLIKKKVSKQEQSKIFKFLKKNEINFLDTAPIYGNSEKIIGNNNSSNFQIISKLPKINKRVKNVEKWTIQNVQNSLLKLKKKKLYAILVHNYKDLISKNGTKIFNVLLRFKKNRKIEKIGISVYNSREANIIIKRYKIDIIQIPFSVIDRRILKNNWINEVKNKNIELHVRSIFLQGCLLHNKNKIPGYFKKWKNFFNMWDLFCRKNNISKEGAAIKFIKNYNNVDKIILGVNSLKELKKNINNFLDKRKINFPKNLKINDEKILNPYNWRV